MLLRLVLGAALALAAAEACAEDAAGLLARQDTLLREAAAGLQAHRPGVAEIYAIVIAGSASEAVFRREAAATRALLDERFDTRGRSLLLSNSPATAEAVPLATLRNIHRAIAEAAARIDPEEDVVALYLTSHGKPGRFLLRHPDLAPEVLTPAALDAMLREAGVGWLIAVISACHAGSFIPALRDERTLVLAAAAADRTSFGCKDENDFTYFGKALVDEELRRSFSFLGAFEAAKRSIADREAALALQPSLPQAFVGDRMAGKLEEIERRLSIAAGGG